MSQVYFTVYQTDKSFNESSVCFASLKGLPDVKAITYYPNPATAITVQLTSDEINRFSQIMSEMGFEISYQPQIPNYQPNNANLRYDIDTTTPRSLFDGKIPKIWILANLMLARHIEEETQVVKLFLELCDRFPLHDKWFLFYVANCFPHPIGNSNHRLIGNPASFKPFDQVIADLKNQPTWDQPELLKFGAITATFCNSNKPHHFFAEYQEQQHLLKKETDPSYRGSMYSIPIVLPTCNNEVEGIFNQLLTEPRKPVLSSLDSRLPYGY